MLKVKYAFDGENPNEDLENLIREQMQEMGFDECGNDAEDDLRVLEFESTVASEAASEMNEAEQAFLASPDKETLQDIIGLSIPLSFDFEPWDDDDEPAPAPPAPSSAYSSDKKLMFLGHCTYDSKTHKSADKIWGVVSAQGEWITFWGSRTKKLQFKKGDDYAGGTTLDKMIRSKENKNYLSTTIEALNALDPEFETRFEEDLIHCMLANNFHKIETRA
jgi:hypothetical protein